MFGFDEKNGGFKLFKQLVKRTKMLEKNRKTAKNGLKVLLKVPETRKNMNICVDKVKNGAIM